MNYLAHLFLSPIQSQVQIGNLMGDFIKGSRLSHLEPEIKQGVLLHRAIDKFTDEHQSVRRLKALLSYERKRFHGIIADISFDHFLAKDWHFYSDKKLVDFVVLTNKNLVSNHHLMPDKMRLMVERMVAQQWLVQYQEQAAIGRAINGVSRRIRFENELHGAGEEVAKHYQEYQHCFDEFFPELIDFVKVESKERNITFAPDDHFINATP